MVTVVVIFIISIWQKETGNTLLEMSGSTNQFGMLNSLPKKKGEPTIFSPSLDYYLRKQHCNYFSFVSIL